MSFTRSQLIILGIGGFIVLSFIIIIFSGIGLRADRNPTILSVWGIDNPVVFEAAKSSFSAENPGVQIVYTQFPEESYEKELIDALAAGQGPDVFFFRSDWMREHGNKIVPAPQRLFTVAKFTELFPQVIIQDFIVDNQIHASPLYIDTLALYYNKDIFDRRGVVFPPTTWSEFQRIVNRGVTASFGGAAPIVARAGDILNALLMQASAEHLQDGHTMQISGTPGITALNLYTSVRAPVVETYTGFANGTIGMMIDYQSAKPLIIARNPRLNFGVALLPQLHSHMPIVPAKYYGLAVSRQSLLSTLAWEFIFYATTNTQIARSYFMASGRPPALRSLIQANIDSPTHGVFASQAIMARSWNMPSSEEVFAIFNTMIQSVLRRTATAHDALTIAERDINALKR